MSSPTTPDTAAPQIAAQHIYLFVAAVTGAVAAAVWFVDVSTPVASVPREVYELLSVVVALTGCGYMVRSAEARLKAQLDSALDEAYRQGYAAGFVDRMAGGPGSPTVRSIH